jgi:hypothetical protein
MDLDCVMWRRARSCRLRSCSRVSSPDKEALRGIRGSPGPPQTAAEVGALGSVPWASGRSVKRAWDQPAQLAGTESALTLLRCLCAASAMSGRSPSRSPPGVS